MSQLVPLPSRRERFRALIERLDATANPQRALDDGLCLERPDGVPQRIAASLELRPRGHHLVVGSVGSGKTTALLEIQKRLQEAEPSWLVSYHDAGGQPPDRGALAALLRERRPNEQVVLADGWDRTLYPDTFRTMVASDLSKFDEIGLVCVGPPQLMVDAPSLEGQWFDRIEFCGAIDPSIESGVKFLDKVLSHRSGGELTSEVRAELIMASGGILRDLLLLARAAVEEAYISGDDRVTSQHTATAASRMGRSLLRVVGAEMWKHMLAMVPEGFEAPGGPALISLKMSEGPISRQLILNRLVIPLPGGIARYIFHPCIVPFLRPQ
jgi:hypothetical protein